MNTKILSQQNYYRYNKMITTINEFKNYLENTPLNLDNYEVHFEVQVTLIANDVKAYAVHPENVNNFIILNYPYIWNTMPLFVNYKTNNYSDTLIVDKDHDMYKEIQKVYYDKNYTLLPKILTKAAILQKEAELPNLADINLEEERKINLGALIAPTEEEEIEAKRREYKINLIYDIDFLKKLIKY